MPDDGKPIGHGLVFHKPSRVTLTELQQIGTGFQHGERILRALERAGFAKFTEDDGYGMLAAGLLVLRSGGVRAHRIAHFVRVVAEALSQDPSSAHLSLVPDEDDDEGPGPKAS